MRYLRCHFACPCNLGVTERTPDRGGPCDRFFEPFDPERKGKVSRKVFRNLMENVGEPFSRAEVRSGGQCGTKDLKHCLITHTVKTP